jgi:hypothetical protein
LIFIHLEEEYGFDINDTVHLYCLHYICMVQINRAFRRFTETWNNHSIRTEHNRTPLQLWQVGMITNGYEAYEEYNGVDDSNEQDDNENSGDIIVDENEYDVLRDQFNPTDEDENSGINIFLGAVRQLLQNRSDDYQA